MTDMTHRFPRGFTLLELMILLTIVGIVAAVAIPSIASRTRPFDIAESSRRLNAEIGRLRARAVAEGQAYELVVDGGSTISIEHGTGDDRVVERTETMPEGASASLNDAASGSITFYPTGRVSGAGNLVISDGTSRHTVRVLASGMTRWIPEQQQ
jgi:type IV fimbrial biogenesis protein FimT